MNNLELYEGVKFSQWDGSGLQIFTQKQYRKHNIYIKMHISHIKIIYTLFWFMCGRSNEMKKKTFSAQLFEYTEQKKEHFA